MRWLEGVHGCGRRGLMEKEVNNMKRESLLNHVSVEVMAVFVIADRCSYWGCPLAPPRLVCRRLTGPLDPQAER